MLIEEPIKGVMKELNVAIIKADFLIEALFIDNLTSQNFYNLLKLKEFFET